MAIHEIDGAALWQKLESIEHRIGSLQLATSDLNGELKRATDRLANHGERIRGLELRIYAIGAGLLGALVYIVSQPGPLS